MVVAKEFYGGDEVVSINFLKDSSPNDEAADETLSLSDLPIYSTDYESNCDYYSKQDQKASFDNDDDVFFEFCSDDFSASNFSSYFESDNIIFCGKLIPQKQPNDFESTEKIKPEKNSALRTKSSSFNNKIPSAIDTEVEDPAFTSLKPRVVKNINSCSVPMLKLRDSELITRKRSRSLEKHVLPGVSAKVLESSATKSRWFLFLFGSATLRKEMELSDMRSRQRRKNLSTMFRSTEEKEMVRASGGRKKRKGLWKFVKALVIGCNSKSQNAAAKGSFISLPLL